MISALSVWTGNIWNTLRHFMYASKLGKWITKLFKNQLLISFTQSPSTRLNEESQNLLMFAGNWFQSHRPFGKFRWIVWIWKISLNRFCFHVENFDFSFGLNSVAARSGVVGERIEKRQKADSRNLNRELWIRCVKGINQMQRKFTALRSCALVSTFTSKCMGKIFIQPLNHTRNFFLNKSAHKIHPSKCFCATGTRRPTPKALVVTFNPGAAWRRLYSLMLMSRSTRRTVASSNPAAIISDALRPSTT